MRYLSCVQAVWRLCGRDRVPSRGLASDAHPWRDGPLPAQAVLLLQLRPTAEALRTPQRGVVPPGGALGRVRAEDLTQRRKEIHIYKYI